MTSSKPFAASKKVERHSKTRLRALAVILAAHQLLYMEKNELVEKHHDINVKDIPVDLLPKEEAEVEEAIKNIENIAVSILKMNKINKKDELFFINTTTLIINSFFETGILTIGVSPHLAFCMILFIYFSDGSSKKHEKLFAPLADADIFHNVFERIDDSKVLDWGKHNECATYALQKGVSYSAATSEKKELHKLPYKSSWHVKLIYLGVQYTCDCEASSQNEAKQIAEKNNPGYCVYLVSDGNNHQLKRKKYSIPNNKKESS